MGRLSRKRRWKLLENDIGYGGDEWGCGRMERNGGKKMRKGRGRKEEDFFVFW